MVVKRTTIATRGKQKTIVPALRIEKQILLIRGEKVMLDADLAELYGVETGALTRTVKRNLDRFPEDLYVTTQ